MGEARARRSVIAMLGLQYLLSIALVISGLFQWSLLLVLLNPGNFQRLIRAYNAPKPDQRPERFPANIWPLWFSAYTFSHNR